MRRLSLLYSTHVNKQASHKHRIRPSFSEAGGHQYEFLRRYYLVMSESGRDFNRGGRKNRRAMFVRTPKGGIQKPEQEEEGKGVEKNPWFLSYYQQFEHVGSGFPKTRNRKYNSFPHLFHLHFPPPLLKAGLPPNEYLQAGEVFLCWECAEVTFDKYH